MSVKAILTEQQKSYTKAEEDALLATNYYNKDYIDTYMAPLDTPTFIGAPKAPTAAVGTSTTQIATTAFVQNGLQRKSNENLLDNWYFLNPVNQRGQSSYTGAVRGIDRWVCRQSTGTVSVTTNGVTLSKGSGSQIDLYQSQEEAFNSQLAGKTVTVSVLLYPNRLVTGTGKWQPSASGALISESDFSVACGQTQTIWTNFYIRATSDITIQAIKLELDSESTLCHNEGTEANPVWVLNEIADYEKELIKCQTNTSVGGDDYANKTLATGQELAYVENGTTASRNYAIGEYFCWHGLLYRAKTAISSGDGFTPGTNCVLKSEGGMNSLLNQVIVNRQVLATSITTGLNTIQVEPTAISGYKAIGVAGVQFAAVDRTKISLVEFLLDGGTYVTVQFNSTYTKTSISVAAFVIYTKE